MKGTFKKCCNDVGDLKRALEDIEAYCPINPVVVEYAITKQRGIITGRLTIREVSEGYKPNDSVLP